MRHLLWAALFLLYCTCGCFAAVVQQLPQKGKSALQTYTVSTTTKTNDKNGNEWYPIRIAVYTKIVDYVVKECENKIRDDDFQNLKKELEGFGDNYVEVEEFFEKELGLLKQLCTDKDNKMTEEKKNILFRDVLPEAIKLHTDRLKVNTVKEKQNIPTYGKNLNINHWCGVFTFSWKQKFKDSDDVDFMIFASLSDDPQDVDICTQNENKRPMSALIKFIPKEIKATRQYIRLTAHEIAHGLGFQHELMRVLRLIEPRYYYMQQRRRSSAPRNPHMVKSEKALEMVKGHFGCTPSKVKGLYLENEGYDKWTPSHWERRIAKDELMSTYIGEPSGMYYSVLTLSAFHSMSFYSADFDMAEPMSWGNQTGCKFLLGEIKNNMLKEYPNMFCKEGNKKILQCTSDRFALGMCSTKKKPKDLPQEYQYFKDDRELENDLMDDYPIIRPLMGTACDGGNKKLLPGSLLGPESRCLKADNLLLHDSNAPKSITIAGVCAKIKCDRDKVRVQLKQRDNSEKWHDCEKDGNKVNLDGSEFQSGTIECPKYEEVCTVLPKNETPTIKFYYSKDVHGTYKDGYGGKKEEENEERNQNRAQLPYQELEGSTDTQSLQNKDGVNKPKDKGQNNGSSNGLENTRESESHAVVQNSQNSSSSSSAAVVDPAKSSTGKTPEVQKDHLTTTNEKGLDENAVNVSQQLADSSAENNVQHEKKTPTNVEDNQQTSSQTPPTKVQIDAKHEESTQGNHRDASDATSPSTSNPNSTEGQMKEVPNNVNIMVMMAPDSSIITSYMVPLVLFVCAVGFVMVP